MLATYALGAAVPRRPLTFCRLNTRQRIRNKIAVDDKGWNSIPMGSLATSNIPKRIQRQASIAAVDFETASVGKSSVMDIAV
jgi:hypothetical protein